MAIVQPYKYPWRFRQGDLINWTLVATDEATGAGIDWTGYSALLELRDDRYNDTAIASFASADGEISLNASGVIQMNVSAATTAAIEEGNYHYDLKVFDGTTDVQFLLEGIVSVIKPVSR